MSAPLKPWERAGVNQHSDFGGLPQNQSRSSIVPVADVGGAAPTPGVGNPPPLPPRPTQQSSYSSYGAGYGGYGSYGSGYGSYGGLGSYSPMYGGYGGYGYNSYGMNRFGQPGYGGNGFVRAAEDSSRQAFQSIESIVQAFGSVAMMLESTYSAVFNSFRAVLGVADHFSRMRTHFAQIFSALAVIKTLRWLYRKLLVLLRLREAGLEEDVWAAASAQTAELLAGSAPSGKPKSSWPIMLFFAVIIGGPWLIWKFLSSLSSNQDDSWVNGDAEHFVAVAQYDFRGDSEEELSIRKGEKINIAPKEQQPRVRGWLLGSVDGKKTGLVPANYVKILGRRRGRKEAVQISRSATTSSAPARSATVSNLEELAPDFGQPSAAQYGPAPDFEQSFSQVGPSPSEQAVFSQIRPSSSEQAVFDNSFPDTGLSGQPSQSQSAFKEATDILDETNLNPQ